MHKNILEYLPSKHNAELFEIASNNCANNLSTFPTTKTSDLSNLLQLKKDEKMMTIPVMSIPVKKSGSGLIERCYRLCVHGEVCLQA